MAEKTEKAEKAQKNEKNGKHAKPEKPRAARSAPAAKEEPAAGDAAPRPQPAPPCVLVIFGATGDLTKRKLLPALYNLAVEGRLPEELAVVGTGRTNTTSEEFRRAMRDELKEFATVKLDPKVVRWLLERLYYTPGEFGDPATYGKLEKAIEEAERERGIGAGEAGEVDKPAGGARLYYLAVPPSFFGDIIEQLGKAGMVQQREGAWRRVIIEKPFGHDLESARSLNRRIAAVLSEDQIYRIDHYLGKETVQNIMALRFANGIFEPIWNRRYVDHVQITVAETVGVEDRGAYYEEAGALRDVMQNHVFQLLCFTAMEPPISFAADAVRDERVKVLRAIHQLSPEEVLTCAVRGQYGEGVIDGARVPAYRSEPHVAPTSATETYAALKVSIDSWRWAGVPFYLRTGKRLPRRVTEIAVQFKCPPFVLFRETGIDSLKPNLLIIYIQPDEGVSLRFEAKRPGPDLKLGTVKMDFEYADYFGSTPETGYETLLYDCMDGDSTLFLRSDMVEASWEVVTPVLDVWKTLVPRNFPNYPTGSWGPKEADELLARDNREWHNPRPQSDRAG